MYIPNGSVGKIISYLTNLNFNVNKFDKYILVFMGFPQSGWIDIGSTRLSRFDFLYKLTRAKAALIDITLIPGETTAYFFKGLSQKLDLDYKQLMDEFYKQSPIKEGYLYPNTYKIPLAISEKHLVYYLINSSKLSYEVLSKKIFGSHFGSRDEKQWFNYLIIASIIQKEAANEDEMPIISSVIYNRLKKGMKLQMDGALNYGLHSHEKITPSMIANDNTSYNTYKFQGLPNYPVCNVGFGALAAAIFPKKTPYLYFVRDPKTKNHVFSINYQAHLNEIKKNN